MTSEFCIILQDKAVTSPTEQTERQDMFYTRDPLSVQKVRAESKHGAASQQSQ